MMMNETLTAIPGIRVGHAHDLTAATGCTVILCPPNTVGGVDQRGGAPGTRETDLLHPMHLVQQVNAIFLSGGSAFGLAVGDGVMRYLEEQGIGVETAVAKVPIVPGAILFDLDLGSATRRPDATMGYAACQNATSDPVMQGSVGAGTGARIGGLAGVTFATKGGIGSAAIDLGNGLMVAALIAVNAAGDVVNEQGEIMAGSRLPPDGNQFANSLNLLKGIAAASPPATNTVIGVVATNASLNKEDINKVAQMAQNGLARAVRPAHTPFDGDTIFALATGTYIANEAIAPPILTALIGAFAAEATAMAIRNAVLNATSLAGLPSARDLGLLG